MKLSPAEIQRYLRHFPLQEIGVAGQIKLKQAKVLCVGAGGLGSPLLQYLAAAGVGTLGIIDGDDVDLTNLQRQTLYNSKQLQQKKVTVAKAFLENLNPHLTINTYAEALNETNAREIIAAYDYIADCTDNFYAKYLINDVCFHLKKTYVFASLSQFEGQCAVFCAANSACYRCLFSEPPNANLAPNCADNGILGVVAGIVGSIQALEIIKLILNIGTPLVNTLLSVNTLDLTFQHLKLTQNPCCPLCAQQLAFEQLSRPEAPTSCQITTENFNSETIVISITDFIRQRQSGNFTLIDVRQPSEHKSYNLGGINIPLNELEQRLVEIPRDKTVVCYCQAGIRSQQAVQLLLARGIKKVYSLEGGVNLWLRQLTK